MVRRLVITLTLGILLTRCGGKLEQGRPFPVEALRVVSLGICGMGD